MPKGKYLKWSEVPEYKKLIIDVIKDVAEQNKTFTLTDVYDKCNERFINLPHGRRDIANAFNLMVSEEFCYARVERRTTIDSIPVTLCKSYIFQGGNNG